MKKLFAKKEVVKKEVVEFKELNDEQLDKIIGGDSRIRMGLRYNRDTEKKA
ncbi:bacteriocin [Streptococcus anginosus]|uniref:bacteriocin n=1 Tax=Streptococcus anginosus TaxID=1328 RepID=UPI0039C10B87